MPGYLAFQSKARDGVLLKDVVDELRRVHLHLANAFLAHVTQAGKDLVDRLLDDPHNVERRDVRFYQRLVDAAIPNVPVASLEDLSILNVTSKPWELTELHRNLCQIAVLTEVLQWERLADSTDVLLHPTQGTGIAEGDANGRRPSKSGSISWVIEAYGGRDVTTNAKLREDVTKLARMDVDEKYFACRSAAISAAADTERHQLWDLRHLNRSVAITPILDSARPDVLRGHRIKVRRVMNIGEVTVLEVGDVVPDV